MNNDETYTPCTKCGRPMAYCKGQCCGKTKGCQCKEYCGKVCGAIRPGEPHCPYQAVIPSLTVESVSNLKDLADCFVHVSNINTTFYIDDKHRIMTTWAGPVEYNNYDLDANSLGLRSQFLIDFANERGAYYDKVGDYRVFEFGEHGGDESDELYTIALSGGQDVGTYASMNWQLETPFRITAGLFGGTEVQITQKDGTEVDIIAIASDLEALARAKYKFRIDVPQGVESDMIMTPNNVLQSQDGVVVISGTYALDEAFFTGEPSEATLLLPPLRWKLNLYTDPDNTFAEFIYETIVSEI